MVGFNGNKWTAPQLQTVQSMHAAGRKWPAIAAAVGHPINSCQQMLSRIRAKKRWDAEQAEMAAKIAAVPAGRSTWTKAQIEILEKLRGDGVDWDEVARRCGHPNAGCQTKLSEVRKARREKGSDEPAPRRGPKPKPYVAPPVVALPPPVPATPLTARTCRITTLQADAELRARIEILGATGGLLGDPLPGRSALDQRRDGGGQEPQRVDYRSAQMRPKPTLPTEPLR